MGTTIIKSANSDAQASVNSDGSLNVTVVSGGGGGGTVNIRGTDGSPITTVNGAINVKIGPEGFSDLSPGYPTQVEIGNTSAILLPANPERKYAHIFNNSSNTIYIQFSSDAALNQGIRLNPGNLYVLSGSGLWLGVVNAIALISGQFIDVLECI